MFINNKTHVNIHVCKVFWNRQLSDSSVYGSFFPLFFRLFQVYTTLWSNLIWIELNQTELGFSIRLSHQFNNNLIIWVHVYSHIMSTKVTITRNKASISKYYCESLLWNEKLWFMCLHNANNSYLASHLLKIIQYVKRSSFVLLLRKSGNRDHRYFWKDH